MRDTGILLITWNFPPRRGGIENLMAQLAAGLRKKHSVPVISAYATDCKDGVFRSPYPGLIPFGLYALCQGALILRRNAGIRIVFGGSVLVAPLVYFLARLFRRKAIVQAHGLDVVYRSWIYQTLCVRWVKYCDAVVANSRFTAALVRDRGVPADRIHVIPLGVDVSRFKPAPNPKQIRQELGVGDRPIILFVGRLARRKGVEEFIRNCLPTIVRQVPGTCFFVAGGNPTDSLIHHDDVLTEIQMTVSDLGLSDYVRLWPNVSDETLLELYQCCDVVVLPVLSSPTDVEGFGMVLLEAGAVGKPVVAFEVGGISDAVVSGRSGTLLRAEDYGALADSVVDLLLRPEMRRAMGEFSRQRMEKELSLEQMFERYEAMSNLVTRQGQRCSGQARSQRKAPIV